MVVVDVGIVVVVGTGVVVVVLVVVDVVEVTEVDVVEDGSEMVFSLSEAPAHPPTASE